MTRIRRSGSVAWRDGRLRDP